MSKEDLLYALVKVNPETYVDYRECTNGLEYSCRKSFATDPGAWFATEIEALESYALQLKAELEETDRISDAGIEAIAKALVNP